MPDDEVPPINNVITLVPRKRPLWEQGPERINEYGEEVCGLPYCATKVYAKHLCSTHYHINRSGRLDAATGQVLASREVFDAQATALKELPNLGEIKDWVYVGQTKEFVNQVNLHRMPLQAAVELDGQVIRALIRNKKFDVRKWQRFKVFNPSERELRLDENGEELLDPEDKNFFNTFIPGKMLWAKGTGEALRPELNILLSSLAPDKTDRAYLERWLAHLVRRPGEMGSALIFKGTHGTGKGTLAAILDEIYGLYISRIRTADLENAHNSWLEDKLLVIGEEMAAGSSSEKKKVMSVMKMYVAGGPLTINRKHVPQYTTEAYARWMLFSNDDTPILMEPTERRYSVIESYNKISDAVVGVLKAAPRTYAQNLLNYLFMIDLHKFNPFEQLQNDALQKVKNNSERDLQR